MPWSSEALGFRFDANPFEARKVIESLVDGRLTFTLADTPDGRRYTVEGRIVTGSVFQLVSAPGSSVMLASPAGFEPAYLP